MEADKVTGLLEYPAVRQQFNLDEQDVAIIGRWVKDLNIRWGIDDDDRRDTDLPFFTENTWKSGLDRLLLGYAMPGQDRNMFAGLLPCDDVEGDQGRVLGSFMHYFEGLLKSVRILETPRTLQDWSSGLRKIVESLFTDSSTLEKELQLLKHLLGRLEKVQQVTGYDDKVELEAVTCQLKKDLTHASFGSGFLAGKVTFCAMLPMRSIPFRVICLLGMQGNAFPRDDSALGFDLMATQPRRGDRSRRNDDKYLFLEALMSARKKLYISYIGRDIQDNSPIAPSVLVSELIDYAHSGYGFPAERLVRQHPLQAFSADYFTETLDLFSYSRDNFTAAVAAQQAPARTGDALELSTPPEAFKHMGAETLGLFYANPLKYFLQNRLGLYLEKEDSLPDTSENFRLAGLEGYKAGQATFQSGLRGAQTQELMGLFKARGVLPPGQVGAHDFTAISLEAGDLASRMNIWTLGEDPRDKAVTLQIGDFSINGSLPDVYGGGMVYARFAKFNPRDLVYCWITHLLLCAANGSPECQKKSVYLSRDVSGVFAPLDNSPKILKHLLQLHWDGLSRPLPFYPKSSHVYARARLIQEKPRRASLRAAVVAMQGNQFSPGEIEEPYLNFFFDGVADLGETFERVALEIFEPLFQHFTSTTAPPPLQLKNIKEL
jgi:exodeoxyribonuclease V gamma subunit